MTKQEYIESRRPSLLDEALEDEAMAHCPARLQLAIVEQELNWNRLIAARAMVHFGVFSEEFNQA